MPAARSVLYGSAVYHMSLWGRTPGTLAMSWQQPWPGDAAHGQALANGEFRFAGETVHAETAPWTAAMRPAFLAELHGFSWLADLAAFADSDAWHKARAWTADWLERCDAWDALAWRADVTGDRVFAWIEHLGLLTGRGTDAALHARLVDSIGRQTRHLSRIATREAPGIARLKALRGLIAGACALASERKLERALSRLEREAAAQILPDGCHIERSPASQLMALGALVDARAAIQAVEITVPPALQSAIDRAAPMLRFFRHGDGGLALFNGSNEDVTERIDLVLARAEAKGRAPISAPHGGFQRLQAGRSLVIADTGVPAASGFDENAHAGTLSFEMSHGRERLIVNCGSYDGPNERWRSVARATAAHSTLVVADTNSAEIDATGVLSRRPTQVPCERVEEDGAQWVAASHDGYESLCGLTHARELFLASDGEDLRGEDRLDGRPGQSFAIRFHLHPHVQVSLTQEGSTVLLRLPSGIGWRLRAHGAVMSLAESIYLGGGTPRKSQQVVLDGHVGTSGAIVRWALRREAKKSADSDGGTS